jgi:poly-gamma-glutamate capsule biosynthesis protein CapA/YwtB (metallophosphatase superfamily)
LSVTTDTSIKLALAGDTLLGATRVGALNERPPHTFFSQDLIELARQADLRIVNLECCISERGERWPAEGKPFFFRAPPRAVEVLNYLGVDCANLANNHSLDYGHEALLDTFEHLSGAGIRWVGAGPDLDRARSSVVLERAGFRLAVLGVADHPDDYAAAPDRPGIALADLRQGEAPAWLMQALGTAAVGSDAVLLTPHWGANYTQSPPAHVRRAAEILGRRATLIAGHSAHVFHGVGGNVLYDLGDFLEAYPGERAAGSFLRRSVRRGVAELRQAARDISSGPDRVAKGGDPVKGQGGSFLQKRLRRVKGLLTEARAYRLRGDMGMFFLVTLTAEAPKRLEAWPLKLAHSHTRLASDAEAAPIKRRFKRACRAFGTSVTEEQGRLVISW